MLTRGLNARGAMVTHGINPRRTFVEVVKVFAATVFAALRQARVVRVTFAAADTVLANLRTSATARVRLSRAAEVQVDDAASKGVSI